MTSPRRSTRTRVPTAPIVVDLISSVTITDTLLQPVPDIVPVQPRRAPIRTTRTVKRKRVDEPESEEEELRIYSPKVRRHHFTPQEKEERNRKRCEEADKKKQRRVEEANLLEAKRAQKAEQARIATANKLQKAQERALKQAEAKEKAAVAARERETKKLKKAEENARKLAVKEAKDTAKSSIKKASFSAFLKERGLTPSSSPESLTGLLGAARQFHLNRNGNAVTISQGSHRVTQDQIVQLRTSIVGAPTGSATESVVATPFVRVALAPPPSAHAERVENNSPLSHDEALVQAREVLALQSPVMDRTTVVIDDDTVPDLGDVDMEPSRENTGVMAGSVLDVPSIQWYEEDDELLSLEQESQELEKQLATVRKRSALRNKNAELRKKIAEWDQ